MRQNLVEWAKAASNGDQIGCLPHVCQTVEHVELDNAFNAVADERWARIRATGKTVPWDEAKAYLAARARDERPRKPAARKLTSSIAA